MLCPGVNDGPHLDRSVRELGALYPTVQTVSVVPVGASPKLEDWSLERDGIELVRPTPAYAREVVAQVGRLQQEFKRRHGKVVVQCSDEYYVTAGVPVPPAAAYDGYPQYENGIGMVRRMQADWARTKRRLSQRPAAIAGRRAVIGSGTLAAPLLDAIAAELNVLAGTEVAVVPVTNTVFGERVNVTGLLCGKDYLSQLRGLRPDCFILPRPSLDYFGEKFLDDMTVDQLEARPGRADHVRDPLERGGDYPARRAASGDAQRCAKRRLLERAKAKRGDGAGLRSDASNADSRTCLCEGSGIPRGGGAGAVRVWHGCNAVHALAGPGRQLRRLRPRRSSLIA